MDKNVWRAAVDLLHAGRRGALATVARTRGSTPVPAGAKMLIGLDGRLVGTVGGGCVEADVIGTALVAQRERQPRLITHHLNADVAGDLGLSCGGTVDIFIEPLVDHPAYVHALEQAAAAIGGVVRTATSWPETPVKVFEDLSDDAMDGPSAAALITPDERFVVERIVPAPRVVIFGAGHVGSAVARAAHMAGFRVLVIDDRADFADAARFSAEVTVLEADVTDALARYTLGTRDAVVIATRGHRQDAAILERVAVTPASYVGLLGSRRKRAVVTKALADAGLPAESLARVRVPIGLSIGAVTPEEIAVAVTAELIAWRRGSSANRAEPIEQSDE
jgi:xanthine dehydrogenase accessory factor